MMDRYCRHALLIGLCLGMALTANASAQDTATVPPPPERQQKGQLDQEQLDQEPADPDEDDGQEEAGPEEVSATGDVWLDARLADVGRYAGRHREAFIDEMVRYLGAARGPLTALMDESEWEPGDVYFACSLARVTGRSCGLIVDLREQQPAASWNTLAAGLGAGPGSEAFARLKRGVVHSYQRWGRPLELDEELSRTFPDHGQPPIQPALGDGEPF
ncbi:hypothetical protein ACW7G2_06710 [Luteimonas sp. A277]